MNIFINLWLPIFRYIGNTISSFNNYLTSPNSIKRNNYLPLYINAHGRQNIPLQQLTAQVIIFCPFEHPKLSVSSLFHLNLNREKVSFPLYDPCFILMYLMRQILLNFLNQFYQYRIQHLLKVAHTFFLFMKQGLGFCTNGGMRTLFSWNIAFKVCR